jgi:hypothetical protein
VIGGLVVAAFVFQVFFRYTYLRDGGRFIRVDRLTEGTCLVWLGPLPRATPRVIGSNAAGDPLIDDATPAPILPLPEGFCR